MTHSCNLAHCDGTRLGHELARDFPEETARLEEALDRLRTRREDRVMPENLQVEPLSEVLGNARVRFWVCPIREHGERRDETGWPVVTVEWVDGIAHCTAPGCDQTSAP